MHTNISAEKLDQIEKLAYALMEAIQSGERERILAAQQALTNEARLDWEALDQRADLAPKDKALARLLAGMAIHELPELIQDPANYPVILSRLRLLKNSAALL
jgi:hypothetical protein